MRFNSMHDRPSLSSPIHVLDLLLDFGFQGVPKRVGKKNAELDTQDPKVVPLFIFAFSLGFSSFPFLLLLLLISQVS